MAQVATIKTRSLQSESLSGDSDRLINDVLLNEGVVDVAGLSFEVLQDTGSNMKVSVGSGTAGDKAVIRRDGRVYIGEHQNATQLLDVAASDPSDARIDRVVYRTYDDEADSSGNTYSDVEIIEGTPSGAPSAPALPSGAISLATIEVGAGVTAIVDANITDLRFEVSYRSPLHPAVITRRNNNTGDVAINTALTNILAVTIPIPANWATYDVEAHVSCTLNDSSGATTGTTIISSKVVHPSGDFVPGLVSQEVEGQNNHDTHIFAHNPYVEGLTTTGNRTFTWQIQRSAVNTTNASRSTLIVRAIRVT